MTSPPRDQADCWDNTALPAAEDLAGRGHDQPEAVPLDEAVPGVRLSTPEGTCYRVTRDYPLCYHYGGHPLEQVREVARTTLPELARDAELEGLDLEKACFIDTETTGLAGGTGTHVFMVGLGHFAGDFFRVDQYFMEDFDQEPGLVAALEEALEGYEAVVSFNGKAFDLPLLETRFILSRRRLSLGGRPHLDLLPASRRLWGLRLESCRLVSLEEAVLGETRVGDVQGALVPEIYFAYLRTRDGMALKPIFDHNRQDVLSLLSLAGRAAKRYEAYLDDAPTEDGIDALDLYSLARLYRAAGRTEASLRCYAACLEAGLPDSLLERAGLECVRLMRRTGRREEALLLCERLADGYPRRLWAMVELAKDLEHRARDYARALAVVDRALGLAQGEDFLSRPDGPGRAAQLDQDSLEHRRRRLAAKKARGVTG